MNASLYEKLNHSAKCLLVVATCMLAVSIANGQNAIPFDSEEWEIQGEYTIEDYKGAKALSLSPGAFALLPGISMKNGIIEYDVAFGPDRGFVFTQFRRQNGGNYEEFYFRPHQSGNPDAMQYTPVYNGVNGWQLYHGENHSVVHNYRDNEWMHIKMVIKDSRMELFIDNMNIPVLDVFELKRKPEAGSVAFAASMTGARIANVTITRPGTISFVNKAKEIPALDAEVVSAWNVSNSFDAEKLGAELTRDVTDGLNWEKIPAEYSGVTNLAQVGVLGEGTNAVLARFIVNSSTDQVKQLLFGFSDLARIYVNGKAVYEGQNVFRFSRLPISGNGRIF